MRVDEALRGYGVKGDIPKIPPIRILKKRHLEMSPNFKQLECLIFTLTPYNKHITLTLILHLTLTLTLT